MADNIASTMQTTSADFERMMKAQSQQNGPTQPRGTLSYQVDQLIADFEKNLDFLRKFRATL